MKMRYVMKKQLIKYLSALSICLIYFCCHKKNPEPKITEYRALEEIAYNEDGTVGSTVNFFYSDNLQLTKAEISAKNIYTYTYYYNNRISKRYHFTGITSSPES